MSEDLIYVEPIETREGTYKDGYVRAILQTKDLIDILQSRIDKALAFLETNEYYVTVMYDNVYDKKEELLNILKGSDKEMNSKDDIKLLIKDLEENIYDYCGDYGTLEHRLEDTLYKILNILKVISGSDEDE